MHQENISTTVTDLMIQHLNDEKLLLKITPVKSLKLI